MVAVAVGVGVTDGLTVALAEGVGVTDGLTVALAEGIATGVADVFV